MRMVGAKAKKALSELLELVQELQKRDRHALRSALRDLQCAETVETVEDWHANMDEALCKIKYLGPSARTTYRRVERIKKLLG